MVGRATGAVKSTTNRPQKNQIERRWQPVPTVEELLRCAAINIIENKHSSMAVYIGRTQLQQVMKAIDAGKKLDDETEEDD